MKGRNVCDFFSIITLVFLFLITGSCTKKESPAENISVTEKTEPAQTEETVFTQNNPEPWRDKEEGHLPKITYRETLTGEQITVLVNHEMNSETPH